MSEMVRKYFPVVKAQGDDEAFFITTSTPDLEGDVVIAEGVDLSDYARSPIITYLHDSTGKGPAYGIPCGTTRALEVLPGVGIKCHGIDWTKPPRPPMIDWVESAWKQRKLRGASVGFISLQSKPHSATGGRIHLRSKLLEWAMCPIPMNLDCQRASADERVMVYRALGLEPPPPIEAENDSARVVSIPSVLAIEKSTEVTRPDGSRLIVLADDPETVTALTVATEASEPAEPIRWNRQLSDAFDVAGEYYEPATVLYGVVSRYIGCEVKELYERSTHVPGPRMGSFLSALEEVLGDWHVDDLRNLRYNGTEAPPVHEVIKLNSRDSRDFLVEGIRFMRGTRCKMVMRIAPSWAGLDVTVYTREVDHTVAMDFVNRTWRRAGELNFLKGEAFALSGEFLTKSGESWGDLFLSEKNQEPLKRAVDLINRKGADTTNRGILMLGEPGTGKTLAARVMMNEAKSTFIWVSARDFYRAGAFGGIAYGFELAKECAPSILVFEDIDNWLGPTTIDLLKTEMDGVSRSAGVITVLTTNYPERLPDALIDRPGRFHDVLHFALPDEALRTKMLAKWLPDLPATDMDTAVKATEGYSGAHVRELATFVKTIREQDGVDIGVALGKALTKLREQRELITAVQTADSRYRPTKAVQEMITKTAEGVKVTKAIVPLNLKMPMPEDMPPDKMPMGECVAKSHEYMKMAAGAMAEGCACAAAAGDGGMATEMSVMGEDMMGMCGRMGQMMKAMKEPMDGDEPHEPLPMDTYAVDGFVIKQGNTLNKGNRGLLKVAIENIKSVLASARAPEDAPEETEPVMESLAFDIEGLKKALDEVLAEVRR